MEMFNLDISIKHIFQVSKMEEKKLLYQKLNFTRSEIML